MNSAARTATVIAGCATCLTLLVLTVAADAMDRVSFVRDGRAAEVVGRVEVTAQDGGMLVLARDGVLWTITAGEQPRLLRDETPFSALPTDELAAKIRSELPAGFDVYSTGHYLVLYNTSREYAQWCGSLFERLYLAFTNVWKQNGFELKEPEFPLVAVVFADRPSFQRFARREAGAGADSIIGYYHLMNNRMTMYDLTGGGNGRGRSTAAINQALARGDTANTIATIVHEATHQIAYNCGLHARLSDTPLWFSEGIAMYFETPDLSSSRGWRGIGAINTNRLHRFSEYARRRPADSLATLLRDDRRFRDTSQSLDAYAEAWTLTYFLLKQRPKQYIEYLKRLSQKPPLIEDGPEKRLAEFTEIFGDLDKLDAEMLRYVSRLR